MAAIQIVRGMRAQAVHQFRQLRHAQASFFPQLGVIATCVPGKEMGALDALGHRFTDSKRIEGTLPDMLEGGLAFVRNNMRVSTRIDTDTGEREDIPQYPMDAVREAVLNALVHRDYSTHTEGMPIQLILYSDRLEITNPGGLYGRLTVDQLGNAQPDTRNPVLVTAMEFMGKTENRYSGIPRIRRAMEELGLPEPVFYDRRGSFTVILYNSSSAQNEKQDEADDSSTHTVDKKGLLDFCRKPRSRKEIVDFLGVSSAQYALRRYLDPLVETGAIRLSIPDRPRSQRQMYSTAPTL